MTLINLKHLQLSQLMDSLANMNMEATIVTELSMGPFVFLFRCVAFPGGSVIYLFIFCYMLPVCSFDVVSLFSSHFFDFDIFGV